MKDDQEYPVNYFGINEDRKALNGFNLLVNHALISRHISTQTTGGNRNT